MKKTRTIEVELLEDAVNNTVVQLPDRVFPGVVLQGDSLKILHNEIMSLLDFLRQNDISEAIEIAQDVLKSLSERLETYEAALNSVGRSLPYSARESHESTE